MWHDLGKFDTEAEGGRMVKEIDFEAEKKSNFNFVFMAYSHY